MSGSPPTNWTNDVAKAAWTLLLVAGVAYIAWRLLHELLPALLVLLAVLGVYRLLVRHHY
jgi:hypothetical protein